MFRWSLRFRLALFWLFTVVVAGALGVLLVEMRDQGSRHQVERAKHVTRDACGEIQRKFTWGVENHSFERAKEADFQNALLEIILGHYEGAEGGFWNTRKGFVAYAFPTHEGTAPKRDMPSTERDRLADISSTALEENQTDLRRGARETLVFSACPIAGASQPTSAWVMMRVPTGVGMEFEHFAWAIGLLLFFVLFTGVAATWLLYRWSKDLRGLENAIKNFSLNSPAELPPSHEPDLQTIVTAFNELSARTRLHRENSDTLARKLAQADRLAALGRMAAGIAHEIRNPMSTIRLKFENAILKPSERMPGAAPVILEELARVDRLVQMLLAMTQPFELRPENVRVADWFAEGFTALKTRAAAENIRLEFSSGVEVWRFDAFHVGRALENLIQNALSFAAPGGLVTVTAFEENGRLVLVVTDDGAGISPELRARLFEPFHTTRAGGTGLGLVLVKEIAEAHGGHILETSPTSGASFRLEIPWQKS